MLVRSRVKRDGFTIVELLIVVVVIAILAAITIVAYNGISNRAKHSAVQSAASQASKKISQFAVTNSELYPEASGGGGIANLSSLGLVNGNGVTYEYRANNTTNPKTFCLTVTQNAVSYFVSNTTSNPSIGGCAGHSQNGIAAVTNLAINPRATASGPSWGNQTPANGDVAFEPTGANDGGSTYRVTTTTAGQIRINIPRQNFVVTDGDKVAISLDLQSPVATQIQFEIGSNGVFPKSDPINVPAGWSRVSGVVPITAASAGTVSLSQVVGVSTSLPSGQTWRATKAIITIGSTQYQYADGNSANWLWNGAVNGSASIGVPIPQ